MYKGLMVSCKEKVRKLGRLGKSVSTCCESFPSFFSVSLGKSNLPGQDKDSLLNTTGIPLELRGGSVVPS